MIVYLCFDLMSPKMDATVFLISCQFAIQTKNEGLQSYLISV